MDPEPFLEYFKPLGDWLIRENARNNVTVGWEVSEYDNYCKNSATDIGRMLGVTIVVLCSGVLQIL